MADKKKYIEQGAALDAVFGQFCASSDETEQALNAAIEEIRAIPAADVAPVVCCRDCGMYECHEYDGGLKHICRLFKRQMQETDFCSYGEKREES